MNQNIEALLLERTGYVKRNLPERVKAVDAALRELGFDHKYMTQETVVETAVKETRSETTSLKRGRKKKD
jgi:hypothetical protein